MASTENQIAVTQIQRIAPEQVPKSLYWSIIGIGAWFAYMFVW